MPKCFIKSELELTNGTSSYDVLFEADDGYQEEQKYVCTEAALKEALTHFNDSHLASLVEDTVQAQALAEERVLTVKTSKESTNFLKQIEEAKVTALAGEAVEALENDSQD